MNLQMGILIFSGGDTNDNTDQDLYDTDAEGDKDQFPQIKGGCFLIISFQISNKLDGGYGLENNFKWSLLLFLQMLPSSSQYTNCHN